MPGTMWSGRQSRPRRRRGKSRRTAPSGFARRSKVRPGVSQWIPPPSDLLDAPSGRPDTRVDYETNAHKYWNDFYKIHENGFFKDRHWLFTEFPELAPIQNQNHLMDLLSENKRSEVPECRSNADGPGLITEEQHRCSSNSLGHKTQTLPVEKKVTQKLSHLEISADEFPGSSATYRILEVGCGVGNTVFPILQTNNDPRLFVYCCDFSSTAIQLVKTNSAYDAARCFAFVHDLCDEDQRYPIPRDSLDIIILIFVLSAIVPDKMQKAISRLSRLLKPGGMMLLRDYGRHDMAQLRFKKGQCLSENFYVRGDGTRVYFFTQDELDTLFTTAGLEKVQNLVDRRLQVNRGKQLTMYRVWIQCKYRKPLLANTGS
ncbi:tRNA N(3)-methylcytidine methyltransferase METTL2A isoform X2 [Myotis myotis]|uniref:tRNA N(3)-methylcytidine methyltransferase METTL2A isoform X2 n=1 Tax=Myotis myotis TaxID=51298 RepID=UPI00174874E7|nr:tRNA N(3)-methylcytidine methyltransferase METTL2A isoform X2 [Myotis myotis]